MHYFIICKNSLSIDLSYSNFPNINNMDSYFKNYNNLKYINLSHMKTSVSNMNNMFSGCSSLELIDLSGFETSSLIEMPSIFDGCSSLESIDLSKFDISNVKDISYMFYNCISLKSINLDNFNALNIENMNYMFSGCESFISLNLSQFYSLSLKHMNSMFSNCISLMILDLSNFKANNINTFSSAFDNCPSLKYINLYNYEGGDIFNSLSYKEKNFIYCMETNEIKNDESFSLYNYINNCSDTCFNSPIIINETEKKCYINCIELEENYFCNYEHSEIINTVPDYFYLDINEKALKKCYSTCKNCFTNGDENDNNCSACIENYKFMEESLNKNNCFEECPFYYFDTLNSFHCIKNISLNDILNDMSSLIIFRDYYEPYYINGENYSIIINSLADNNNNITSKNKINFSNCEKILKNKYPEQEFIFVQYNIDNHNEKSLTDKVEYEVYNSYGEKVDLSVCNNVTINIIYKINKISILDIEKIKIFREKGIDIFNIEEDFFNDICFPYSDEASNSDMILTDRVSDIYQNFSLCEEGCEYEYLDIEGNSVKCNCNIKKRIDPEVKEPVLKTYFVSAFLESNFGIIKCYKLVFSINGKLNNIGFWIFSFMNILNLISFLFYCINGMNPVKNYIKKEMHNKGYNSNKKNDNDNNISTNHSKLEKKEQNIDEDTKGNFFEKKSIYKKTSNKIKITSLSNTPKKKLQYKDDKNGNNLEFIYIVLTNGKVLKDSNISSARNIIKGEKENKDNEPQKSQKILYINNNIQRKKDKQKNRLEKRFSTIIPKVESRKSDENLLKYQITDIKNETQKRKRFSIFPSKANNNFIFESNKNEINRLTKKNHKKDKIRNDNNEQNEYPLILINANNIDNYIPLKSNYILDNYDYDEAIIYDKRTFCRILFIYLMAKNDILNIIFFNPPLELKPLRINIFIFNYACDLGLNALFFLSDNISDKYHYTGVNKLLFSLINNLTISLTSVIVSSLLLTFFQKLTQSTEKLEELFKTQDNLLKLNKKYKVNKITIREIKDSIKKILKCLKIKIIIFIIFETLFFLFFFYYVTAFCHVYKSTQIDWILDSISSYAMSYITSLLISIFSSIFYKLVIRYKFRILYKILIFIYSFG